MRSMDVQVVTPETPHERNRAIADAACFLPLWADKLRIDTLVANMRMKAHAIVGGMRPKEQSWTASAASTIINCALRRTPMTGAQPVRRHIALARTPTGLFIFGEKGDREVCLADLLKDDGGGEVV
jgi:hypothetical protein